MYFTSAIYKKLAIAEIEELHRLNNIPIPISKLKGNERRDELYESYSEITKLTILIKTENFENVYKNVKLDNYISKNFPIIIKNLKTYKIIINCAKEVAKHMSLHCDENAFQKALESELQVYDNVTRERYIPIFYKQTLVQQLRIDLEFRDFVIELKLIDKLQQKNDWQLKAYLDNTDYKKGILINFNTKQSGNRGLIDTKIIIK
jgi:GxxExxY protein